MERPKRIVLDMDRTIVDLNNQYVIDTLIEPLMRVAQDDEHRRKYRNNYNSALLVEEWLNAAWSEDISSCEYPEVGQEAIKLLRTPKFLLGLSPIEGSLEAMQTIYGHDIGIHIVSARLDTMKLISEEWLENNRLLPFIEDIHQRPIGEKRINFKIGIAKSIGAEVIVDDNNLIAQFAAYKIGIISYLVDSKLRFKEKGLLRVRRSFHEATPSIIQEFEKNPAILCSS